MSVGLLNTIMLLGLAGLAIPPIIHLLNRRRFQVVDWGAMQFLQISETTRRRLLIEELLLMLLRMGAIGVLVFALASPYVESPALAHLVQANRDVVLIFDGSTSMGLRDATGRSAQSAAQEWAQSFLDELHAGDGVGILIAKQQPQTHLEFTHDLSRARQSIPSLRAPSGGCDWPQAVQAAVKLLEKGQRPQREIILLTDNQRFGWADDASLMRWEMVAAAFRPNGGASAVLPRIRVVNCDPARPADPPNWSLAPLHASRAVASTGQTMTFRTALELHGQKEFGRPHRIRLEIDGLPATDLQAPTAAKMEKGQVPLTFTHRFATPGSHLVSVIVEPDPPAELRPPDYALKDWLPGDNRQDFAVEIVPALPVLLVDGDNRPAPKTRGTDFLRDALAPARDRTPVITARVVSVRDFTSQLLTGDLGKEAGSKPRVVVFCNVPRLTKEQQEAVAQFLADGGGVLVTLGDRVEAEAYNAELYRAGLGWLPARLEEATGDEREPASAVRPLPSSFFHPALDLFRESVAGGLGEARFPRVWKLAPPDRESAATVVALFTNNDSFLVEKPYRAGRVLLCAAPLNNAWHTNLTELPAFAPLAHELVYYLAGTRAAEHNLQPGQPLRYPLPHEGSTEGLKLQRPGEQPYPVVFDPGAQPDSHRAHKQAHAAGTSVVLEGARDAGVYQMCNAEGRVDYFVVQPDHRESDLTPCSDDDRARVAKLVPMEYLSTNDATKGALARTQERQEVWWWCLFAVIALLCGEVWMTRRLVRGR
jgi:hypothetical protein